MPGSHKKEERWALKIDGKRCQNEDTILQIEKNSFWDLILSLDKINFLYKNISYVIIQGMFSICFMQQEPCLMDVWTITGCVCKDDTLVINHPGFWNHWGASQQ